MTGYVVVGLRAGLGNQLFQYASGYGIATTVGAELRFDAAELFEDERWLPRLLGPVYRPASRAQLLRLGILHGTDRWRDQFARSALTNAIGLSRRFRHRSAATLPHHPSGNNAGRYDASLLATDLPTRLLGWFQTERYFAHVADDIVRDLQLPHATLIRPKGSRPIVALSFRRGDYVRMGWQLPFSYYERALDALTAEVPDATFLVFGDDPEFVRLATEWAARYGPATNAYDFSAGPLEQLTLASQCDHAVIANSSFAWWGAWLGDHRFRDARRLVFAPEDYRDRFGPDILPDRWISVTSEDG